MEIDWKKAERARKTRTTKGEYRAYRKLYVYHGKPNQKWCYLKKEDLKKIPKEVIESIHNLILHKQLHKYYTIQKSQI